MAWRGVPKKEAFMPLFAEDWNLVVDSLNDLYGWLWLPLGRNLIPEKDAYFDIGSYYYRWREIWGLRGYFSSVFADLVKSLYGIFTQYVQSPEIRSNYALLSQYLQSPEVRSSYALLSQYLQSPEIRATRAILSQYLQSPQITGTRGDFTQLYIKGSPIEEVAVAVKTLQDIYTSIWPYFDAVYMVGLPKKRFLSTHSVFAYAQQVFTDVLYLAGQPFPVGIYAAIQYFYPEALNQLYGIIGQPEQEIKVLLSEKLVREIEETESHFIDTSTQSSPFILPVPPPFTNIVIKNWYILTNSTTGDIQLRSVYLNDLIGWCPASVVRQAGNQNMWLPLYYDDYLQLLWFNLYLYSQILLQLTVYKRPCDISIR